MRLYIHPDTLTSRNRIPSAPYTLHCLTFLSPSRTRSLTRSFNKRSSSNALKQCTEKSHNAHTYTPNKTLSPINPSTVACESAQLSIRQARRAAPPRQMIIDGPRARSGYTHIHLRVYIYIYRARYVCIP